MNEVSHARLGRLISFTLLCQKIAKPGRKRFSKRLINELKNFRLSLAQAKDDPVLGKLAENRSAVLEELLLFMEATNENDDTAAKMHYEEADRIHNLGDRIADSIREGADG